MQLTVYSHRYELTDGCGCKWTSGSLTYHDKFVAKAKCRGSNGDRVPYIAEILLMTTYSDDLSLIERPTKWGEWE